jgi:hypothetical protein
MQLKTVGHTPLAGLGVGARRVQLESLPLLQAPSRAPAADQARTRRLVDSKGVLGARLVKLP